MPKYTCERCSKTFDQKIDYKRHCERKTSCVDATKLHELEEKKRQEMERDETKKLAVLFGRCMDILRDSETIVEKKALQNFTYLLTLKLIEPLLGREINLDDHDYQLDESESAKYVEKLKKKYVPFSKLCDCKTENLSIMIDAIWKTILSQHPQTKAIFQPGKKFDIKKSTTFRALLTELQKIDMSTIDVDIIGHAYEELLKNILTGRVLGQFFTPVEAKELMVDLVEPKLFSDGTCETVFDPAMGTGGFLLTVLDRLRKQSHENEIKIDWSFVSNHIGGREAEEDTFALAKANAIIATGHVFNSQEHGDSIRDPITGKYDIVLTNPPFGIKGLKYDEITSHLRDSYLPIKSNSGIPLFIQAVIGILKIGGRGASVVPDGKELFGDSNELVSLREYLMKTCELRAVIRLPPDIFTNTSVKTCLLYFHKRREGEDVVSIGGKKQRKYKFVSEHATQRVAFYDYNPVSKEKTLLVEADIDTIARKNYSLNYSEYLVREEKNEEVYGESVEWKTLGEVCEIRNGKRIVKGLVEKGEYPVYGGGDISFYCNMYNREGFTCKISRDAMSAHNCVLLLRGKFYMNSQGLTVHSVTGDLLDEFLGYFLMEHRQDVYNMGRGAAQRMLDIDRFKQMRIPIPPLPVQRAVVEQLNLLHERDIPQSKAKIESLRRKRDIIVREMTKDCETRRLEEVCEINPENMKKSEWETINYIDIASVNNGRLLEYKSLSSDFPSRAKRKARKGDIIYSTVRPNLQGYTYIDMDIENCVVSTGFAVIRPKTINSRYVKYFFSLKQTADMLASKATGAQYPAVTGDVFARLYIPLPPPSVQQAIVDRCERIDALIAELEADIALTEELAKTVLQNALKFGDGPSVAEPNIIFVDEEEKKEDDSSVIVGEN